MSEIKKSLKMNKKKILIYVAVIFLLWVDKNGEKTFLFLFISDVFSWFQTWNHWKRFKINNKGWKRLKKVFRPAFGWAYHPKAGQNTQQLLVQKNMIWEILKLSLVKWCRVSFRAHNFVNIILGGTLVHKGRDSGNDFSFPFPFLKIFYF